MTASKKDAGSRIVPPPTGRKPNLDDPAVLEFMRTGNAPVSISDENALTQMEADIQEDDRSREEGNQIPVTAPVAKNSWDELPNGKANRQYVVRLTDYEADILSFLGDTTRGETMQSIVRRAIQKELKRMMAERGHKVTFNDPSKK